MPNLTAAIDAFDQALLVSAKARTKIAVIYLQSARDLYQDRDARRRYSRAIWLYLDKATTYDSDLTKCINLGNDNRQQRHTGRENHRVDLIARNRW